jgi:hypothetical protein
MATKKKRGKVQPPSPADLRGVETFDTEERVILVLANVEPAAEAFATLKKAQVHERDVLGGKPVAIRNPSYLALRLRGHRWTLVVACTSGRTSFLEAADAKSLSKALKTKAIYFANSDCASATEYELFDAGKTRERFRCVNEVELTSEVRDVDPPEDGPGTYEFVDRFMREQDAFVPACSIHLNAGGMTSGQKLELAPDELPVEIERLDFVAAGGRRAAT